MCLVSLSKATVLHLLVQHVDVAMVLAQLLSGELVVGLLLWKGFPARRCRHEQRPPEELHGGVPVHNRLEELLVERHRVTEDPLSCHCELGIVVPTHPCGHGAAILLHEEVRPDSMEVFGLWLGAVEDGHTWHARGAGMPSVAVEVEVTLFPPEALPDGGQRDGHVKGRVLRAAVALQEENHIRQLLVLPDDPREVGGGLAPLVRDVLEVHGHVPLRVERLYGNL
mmetsp:Transcript_107081/g.298233  ORF Transcript_107081/g.298233 Transcript_107081/m.298233 type:complete len:225 (+) Transcript_107081:66-740(+)